MIRIFQHYVSPTLLVQMGGDLFALWATSVVTAWLVGANGVAVTDPTTLGLGLALITVLVSFVGGLYPRGPVSSARELYVRAAVCVLVASACSVVMIALASIQLVPSKPYVLAVVGSTVIVVLIRALSCGTSARASSKYRVLVVGAGKAAQTVARALASADRHATVVGFVPSSVDGVTAVPSSALITAKRSLADIAREAHADEIVVAITDRRGGAMDMPELLACRAIGIQVSDMTSYFERVLGQIRLEHLHAGWLVFGDGFNQGGMRTFVKRVFDVLVSSMLLVMSLPVVALAIVLIRLDSKGSAFFVQERIGLHGEKFTLFKLRSMRVGAQPAGVETMAVANDPRTTRVGRLIRLMRIDEIPQLLNVLRGEMSLVGPRPEQPNHVKHYCDEIPFYALRHSVKPGLTGWAQVRYQYADSIEGTRNKLQYDLYYVKNHTLFLDSLVLLKTVGVVLTGQGAR